MRGMIASYIAMVTAFSAVNLNFLPPVIQWLWPSLLGVPLIVAWIRHYRAKFQPRNLPVG